MLIKELVQIDIIEALSLILDVFMEFEAPDYEEAGVIAFKSFLEDEDAISMLSYYGAYEDNILIGVIAMRNTCHIAMLFVKKQYHRRGVAKALFKYVVSQTSQKKITVNSSPYAVEVYHHLGFYDTDYEKIIDGIRFTPMQYEK